MKGEKLETKDEKAIEKYLSAKEVAEMMGLTVRNIYYLRDKKLIKPYKVSQRAVRYKHSEIKEYIRSLNECKT